jgi:hypothetical protein
LLTSTGTSKLYKNYKLETMIEGDRIIATTGAIASQKTLPIIVEE